MLCLSDQCYQTLAALDLPHLHLKRLADFEAADPEVAATRPHRSMIEYFFTCSPAWKLHVLDSEPDAEWVTYLDSDLFFFASPDPIYDEMKDASFGIIPHRYTPRLRAMLRFGTYNVGWVSVRRSEEGIAALRWWRERCIEWCYDRVEGDRFADQRYLDRLPGMFPNVRVIGLLGANLAPWNIGNYDVGFRDGAVIIDHVERLIFFHFHGVKHIGNYYFNGHRLFGAPFSDVTKRRIYQPYIEALAAAEQVAAPYLAPESLSALRRPVAIGLRERLRSNVSKARLSLFRRLDILTGRAMSAPAASAS